MKSVKLNRPSCLSLSHPSNRQPTMSKKGATHQIGQLVLQLVIILRVTNVEPYLFYVQFYNNVVEEMLIQSLLYMLLLLCSKF